MLPRISATCRVVLAAAIVLFAPVAVAFAQKPDA